MLTKPTALAMVEAELAKLSPLPEGDAWLVFDERTIERPFGWVFFYGSRLFAKTGDIRYAVAGNSPFIVNRHTGELHAIGTALPAEQYIAAYEARLATGNA
jgi:Immunity protein 35